LVKIRHFVLQRECISIHVGQAGCQMGNACWELYCLEHGQWRTFDFLKFTFEYLEKTSKSLSPFIQKLI
jgi:hypothetical protein